MVMSVKEENNARGFKEWSKKISLQKITLGQRHERTEGESPIDIWGQKREQQE